MDELVRARSAGETGLGRRVRNDAQLSLRELADELGVDPSTLARWERNSSRPRTGHARRWIAVLDRLTVRLEGDVKE